MQRIAFVRAVRHFEYAIIDQADPAAFLCRGVSGNTAISRAGSVSKSACGILFRQFLHKTPIGYLIDYRLRKAEHLLTATGRKITDIAFGVGSPSVSYFIGTFRKTYGISPNRYRKAISIS